MKMSRYIFYPGNRSPQLCACCEALKQKGYGVVDRPCESVTHLLLPVVSFREDGSLKGDGDLKAMLEKLPAGITVVGGKLNHPLLAGYAKMDLLKDASYLADNAAITAYCALRLAMMELPVMLRGCQVLVIGWGRIGKCLSALLWALEAEVTVVARKEEDRAMAHALGYHAEAPENLGRELNRFQLIYNTAPATVLTEEQMGNCRETCLKIDLASVRGIPDTHVIWARGLPGKDTPGSSGKLIAKTIIRLLDRKERL